MCALAERTLIRIFGKLFLLSEANYSGNFMRDLVAEFIEYKNSVSIDRIRASQVPADLRPLYDCYMMSLKSCLSDPDEQSINSLGPNDRHNAMVMVRHKFGLKHQRELGDCPRCGGTGEVIAYRHILNGQCLKCGGSGWIKSKS